MAVDDDFAAAPAKDAAVGKICLRRTGGVLFCDGLIMPPENEKERRETLRKDETTLNYSCSEPGTNPGEIMDSAG